MADSKRRAFERIAGIVDAQIATAKWHTGFAATISKSGTPAKRAWWRLESKESATEARELANALRIVRRSMGLTKKRATRG